MPWYTELIPDGDRQWKVQQTLCGLSATAESYGAITDDDATSSFSANTAETEWALLGRVDLREPAEGRPLFGLLSFER